MFRYFSTEKQDIKLKMFGTALNNMREDNVLSFKCEAYR